jgi:hypothetical protein
LQKEGGSRGGGRYIKRGSGLAGGRHRNRAAQQAAAVTQSGGRLSRRPLQKQGGSAGGRYRNRAAVTGGRYRNNALGQDAPTIRWVMAMAVTVRNTQ